MDKEVVACLVSCDEEWLLLRRSPEVGSDGGRWHCVTGFCERGATPLEQAHRELKEETGLAPHDVQLRAELKPLALPDDEGQLWTVHVFHFAARRRYVELNWEHDAVRWTDDRRLEQLEIVPWLPELYEHLARHR